MTKPFREKRNEFIFVAIFPETCRNTKFPAKTLRCNKSEQTGSKLQATTSNHQKEATRQ
jgi:hypothetical protein